jgi:hypothetical protein
MHKEPMLKHKIGFYISIFANIAAVICIIVSIYFFVRHAFITDGTGRDYGLQVLGLLYLLFTLPCFLVALLSLKITKYPKETYIYKFSYIGAWVALIIFVLFNIAPLILFLIGAV